MTKNEYKVYFVELESGRVPFYKSLDSLTKKERTEVLALIEEFRLLKSKGEDLPRVMSRF